MDGTRLNEKKKEKRTNEAKCGINAHIRSLHSRVGAQMDECVLFISTTTFICHRAQSSRKMSHFSLKIHFPFLFFFVIAFSTVFRLSDTMINDFITWARDIRPNRNSSSRRQNQHEKHTKGKSHNYYFIYERFFVCLMLLEKPQEKLRWQRAHTMAESMSASMEQITRATTLRFLSHQAKLIDIVENGAVADEWECEELLCSVRCLTHANDGRHRWSRKQFLFLNKISKFLWAKAICSYKK